MLRTGVTVGLVLVVVGVSLAAASAEDLQWRLYKSVYDKNYADPNEDSARRAIFLENKRQIEEHNALRGADYLMQLNQFADLTREELRTLRGGVARSREQHEEEQQARLDVGDPLGKWLLADDEPIPDEVDWRKAPGRVSEVLNQGVCASDWAIAAVGALEGQQAKLNFTKLIPLSVQNVVDCSSSNWACGGGFANWALRDLAKQQGIDDQESYPYTAAKGSCRFNKDKSVMPVLGYKLIPHDEDAIKRVVAKFGPVAARMDTQSRLVNYRSGIYADDPYCIRDPFYIMNSVLIVGYGRDKKRGDYWIIKNSWGKEWGEQGYFRMVMHENMCGIAWAATIPTI